MPDYTRARVIGVARDVLSGYLATSVDREGAMVYFATNARAAHNDSILVRTTAVRARHGSGLRRRWTGSRPA